MTNGSLKVGDRVILLIPENCRLNGAKAMVVEITDWGAHVATTASGSGLFRAFHSEMTLVKVEYTGDCCETCGSIRLRRAGACLVCEDCGSNSGCG